MRFPIFLCRACRNSNIDKTNGVIAAEDVHDLDVLNMWMSYGIFSGRTPFGILFSSDNRS